MPLFLPGQAHPPMLRQEKPPGHLIPTVNAKSISQRSIITDTGKKYIIKINLTTARLCLISYPICLNRHHASQYSMIHGNLKDANIIGITLLMVMK